MKINLKFNQLRDAWVDVKDSNFSLCNPVIRLLTTKMEECSMIVRFKNPKQKGFIRVNLVRPRFFWQWRIPEIVLPSHESSNHYFCGNVTNLIQQQFGDEREATVWIKFV